MALPLNLKTDPVPGLIRKIAFPAALGMLFSTLLNVVDTYYAGMLSPTALAALSLSGPLFFLVLTLGIGVGQATNALVGNRLGADRPAEARILALQCISFATVFSCGSAALVFVFVPLLFQWMGGEPPYLADAVLYMRTVLLGTAFFSLALVSNSILNTRGDSRSYRNAQFVGCIANVFLDPFFMFTLDMGVVGVAVATVLIQAGIFLYLLRRVLKLDFLQHSSWSDLIPKQQRYTEIAGQSMPASASMILVAVGSIIIVSYVTRFGESAMAAYAVALRLEQMILLPVIGINIAALSLTGVNFGAGRWERVGEVYRTSTRYALLLMIGGGVLVFLSGSLVMSLFSDSDEVQHIGTVYLRFEAFILPAYAVIFLSAAVLQGLKRPLLAMYFNAIRQVFAQLLLFWIAVDLLRTGIEGIWWSVLIINWVLATVLYWLVRRQVQRDTATPSGTALS